MRPAARLATAAVLRVSASLRRCVAGRCGAGATPERFSGRLCCHASM